MGRSPPSSASARIGRNIERSTHNQGARSTGPPIGMDSCVARSSNVAVGGLSPLSHALWKTIPGGGGGDGGIVPEAMDVSARLAWRDLFVTASNARGDVQVLLHRLSGYAEPGNITAIMGPSGSGKSTLLDTLAGRLAKNTTLTGEIFLNGRKKQLSYGVAAYVTQDDTLIGTLTVRETIAFSANLRLPDRMPASKKRAIVESTIVEMGLQESADTAIGNWHLRGLSGGEKRRVSIALEILTRPRLLFLDEPTSGLDSASAFFVTQTLKNLARDGRTVIASIHQPSSEVFELFDNLCLLSQGKLIYFGNGYGAREFFADAGFPCPELRNPSDHYLRAVNADFDRVQATLRGALKLKDLEYADPLDRVSTSKVIAILVEAFQSSGYAMMMAAKVHEVSQTKGVVLQSTGSHASFFMQAATLTLRSFKNMTRDMGYYWLRLAIYVILNIGIGTLYFRIGTDYGSISARAACMSYVGGFLTFMSIGGFPSFVEDIKVRKR
ncbi:ABC transporter G family member 11 [Selaginella moellendorffii]|nr:ABC transporter G family member 11 [Selaginella moellendorffii]|eukprot:XP_002974167.2 ABC transporter G family member 11 [Selaginella moellendorffii]